MGGRSWGEKFRFFFYLVTAVFNALL
jgi:hypothetical protein